MSPPPAPARRLVMLDLDGTLVDSFRDIHAAARVALDDGGLTLSEERLWLLVRAGAPLEELYAAAGGDDADGMARFITAYRATYFPSSLVHTRAYPGVPQALAALRALPVPPVLVVATAKRSDSARHILAGTGLLELVDAVAGSEGIPAKPDPAVLHRAAGLVELPLAGALMVGDTVRDVLAARAAGCAACAVSYGGARRDALEAAGADGVLDEFGALVGWFGSWAASS